jgi:hypothetical protein
VRCQHANQCQSPRSCVGHVESSPTAGDYGARLLMGTCQRAHRHAVASRAQPTASGQTAAVPASSRGHRSRQPRKISAAKTGADGSGIGQSLGYLMAAAGKLLFGLIRQHRQLANPAGIGRHADCRTNHRRLPRQRTQSCRLPIATESHGLFSTTSATQVPPYLGDGVERAQVSRLGMNCPGDWQRPMLASGSLASESRAHGPRRR